MKLLILTVLALTVVTTPAEAIEIDKVAHAVGSYGLTHATQAICNRLTDGEHEMTCLVTGVVTAGAIGATKELLDQHKGTNTVKQSLEDGAADMIGIGLAVTFISIDF